jgi:sugar-specific transcriptional regulator TrmB
MDLTEVLAQLGFDRAEVAAYLTLLQSGPLAVATLGKRLGLPRTTVYTMLDRLSGRGLVRESARKGLKVYSAEPPDSLGHIFSQRVVALEKAHTQFLRMLPDLRAKRAQVAGTPRLSILEGKEGLQNLLREMLLYADIETCAVWPIKKMIEVLSPEFFALHNKERIKRNIYTRAVWPESEVVSIAEHPFLGWGKEFKREIRIAPKKMQYALGYWIYANKVAFLSSSRESYGFLIQSDELAETLTAQFELLWHASTPLIFDQGVVDEFLRELEK